MTAAAVRRWTHASTALVLFLPPFVGWPVTRWILIAGVFVWSGVEVARLRSERIAALLTRALPVFRGREANRPSGALWLAVGHAACGWFPAGPATMGILAGALADPAASWVGQLRGTDQSKSNAGSIAATVVTAGLALGLGVTMWRALLVGVVVAATERYPGPLDDNVLVGPVAAGLFLWLT